jgi:hypothetical protein
MPGLVPGIHVFPARGYKDVDGRNKSGHDAEMLCSLFNGMNARHLPQTIPAQAIAAVCWHRQPRIFLGAPALPRQAAGKFCSATGTGEAARRLRSFQAIYHAANSIVTGF